MSLVPQSYVGGPISALPTPALVIDRAVVKRNCLKMQDVVRSNEMLFRAHVKTHKTAQGTVLQLDPEEKGRSETRALIISTIEEGWGLVRDVVGPHAGLVATVLYALPPIPPAIQRLVALRKALSALDCTLLVMVDHPAQIAELDRAANGLDWQCFVKTTDADDRAGLDPGSSPFEKLITALAKSEHTRIYGFYSHAGTSYDATSDAQAAQYLDGEIETVDRASQRARQIIRDVSSEVAASYESHPWILSVGATPTAHAADKNKKLLGSKGKLKEGFLELHAGNYTMHDLQQLHTSLIATEDVACQVVATVCSVYPERGQAGEALCDAGGLAMSKDRGPIAGFGLVKEDHLKGWTLGRPSQEHGILTFPEGKPAKLPEYGEMIRIIPQHACLTLAAHKAFYIVDSSLENADWRTWQVREVWEPWKFW